MSLDEIYDMLYLGEEASEYDQAQELFRSSFPDLKQSDGSDGYHGYRLVLEGKVDVKKYFSFLIDEKYAARSFVVSMAASVRGKHTEVLEEIIRERKDRRTH